MEIWPQGTVRFVRCAQVTHSDHQDFCIQVLQVMLRSPVQSWLAWGSPWASHEIPVSPDPLDPLLLTSKSTWGHVSRKRRPRGTSEVKPTAGGDPGEETQPAWLCNMTNHYKMNTMKIIIIIISSLSKHTATSVLKYLILF